MRLASPILSRNCRPAAFCAAALLLGWLTVGDVTARGRLSHDLDALRLVAGAEGRVDVIILYATELEPGQSARVRGHGGESVRELKGIRGMAASIPVGSLEQLAEDPAVRSISFDEPVRAASNVSVEAMGAWLVREVTGVDGTGVRVAVIDSGVAPVPGLGVDRDRPLGRIAAWIDLVEPNRRFPIDPFGHGTHVAGIIAGEALQIRGPTGEPASYGGMAPGAEIVSVRVLDRDGKGRASDVIAGLQWVTEHAEELGIRVVNLSLGHPVRERAADDPLVQACEAAWNAGLVVVTSAGNLGLEGLGTITSPGNSSRILTVGTLVDQDTPRRTDDEIATYSSRGPSRFDGTVKPDLLAPGDSIVSLRSPQSDLDRAFRENRVGSGPRAQGFRLSGTSMSAAAVSGGAALLLSMAPELDADSLKATLMRTAEKRPESLWARGAGAIDLIAAMDALDEMDSMNALDPAASSLSPRAFAQDATVAMTDPGWGGEWMATELYGPRAHWDLDLAWELLQEPDDGGELLWQLPSVRDGEAPAIRWKRVPGPSPTSVVWQVAGESVVWQGKGPRVGTESVVWQLNGESVVWQKDLRMSAESVVWQMDGRLSSESVVWQGDMRLSAESVVWQGRGDPLRILILGEAGLVP